MYINDLSSCKSGDSINSGKQLKKMISKNLPLEMVGSKYMFEYLKHPENKLPNFGKSCLTSSTKPEEFFSDNLRTNIDNVASKKFKYPKCGTYGLKCLEYFQKARRDMVVRHALTLRRQRLSPFTCKSQPNDDVSMEGNYVLKKSLEMIHCNGKTNGVIVEEDSLTDELSEIESSVDEEKAYENLSNVLENRGKHKDKDKTRSKGNVKSKIKQKDKKKPSKYEQGNKGMPKRKSLVEYTKHMSKNKIHSTGHLELYGYRMRGRSVFSQLKFLPYKIYRVSTA